jgi:hypothetical protein
MIELAVAIVAAAHQRFDLAGVRIESDQGDLRSYRGPNMMDFDSEEQSSAAGFWNPKTSRLGKDDKTAID